MRASREEAVKRLGTRLVLPDNVVVPEGEDRLAAIVKAQKAAKKANEGLVRAGNGVPAGWRPPATSEPPPTPQPAKKLASAIMRAAKTPGRRS